MAMTEQEVQAMAIELGLDADIVRKSAKVVDDDIKADKAACIPAYVYAKDADTMTITIPHFKQQVIANTTGKSADGKRDVKYQGMVSIGGGNVIIKGTDGFIGYKKARVSNLYLYSK